MPAPPQTSAAAVGFETLSVMRRNVKKIRKYKLWALGGVQSSILRCGCCARPMTVGVSKRLPSKISGTVSICIRG